MANMTNTTRNIPSELPEVEFVDTDTEALVNKLIAGYEEITGRTLYPADPVRAFILWLASVIIQERVNINESAKQNLPRYATGQNLDSLSEIFHNTYRLQPTAARTMLGFSITTALDKEYVITDEIEVTVDGYINFVTTGYLTFPAGETYAEVEAVCTTLGEDGNGFTPGQVSRLVTEEFLYFKEVANTTETAGGMVNIKNRERDEEVTLDICKDTQDGLTVGVNTEAREYVAQVIIPARGYEIVDTGEKDEDGKTITKREPVPFDMKKCTLVLWALI